jgi:hypothetical protein
MITHTWSITDLDVSTINDKQNVITGIYWKLSSTDGIKSFEVSKMQPITYIEDDEFIEYDNLTQEMVLEWLKNSMADRYTMFQEQAEININRIETKLSLPW